MCKKIIISFLIVGLFNLLFGCQSSKLVSVNEYNQIEKEDKPKKIQVMTKDGQRYHFSNSNFYVANDTLYGKEQLTINEKWIPFDGKFSFNEIEEIEFYSVENKWTYQFSINEFQQIENKPDEIFVIKTDSTKYYFKNDGYFIDSDTLYGRGKSLLLEEEKILDIEIACSDIQYIKITEVDKLATGILFFVSIGLIVFIILGISMANSTNSPKSCRVEGLEE